MLKLVSGDVQQRRDATAYSAIAPMLPILPDYMFNLLVGRGTNDEFTRLQQIQCFKSDIPSAFLLTEGWAASAIIKNSGELCMISLYFPGDLIGLPQILTPNCSEVNFALSDVSALRIDGRTIKTIFKHPEYNDALASIMHRERSMLVDRLVASAQGDSASKLAQFFLQLVNRSALKPLDNKLQLQTPLRQTDIADFVSMTSVHVNRTLRGPRLRDLVAIRSGLIHITDASQLAFLAGRHRLHSFLRAE